MESYINLGKSLIKVFTVGVMEGRSYVLKWQARPRRRGAEISVSKKTLGIATGPWLLLLFCAVTHPALAADFDGSKPLVCAMIEVFECGPDTGCESGTQNGRRWSLALTEATGYLVLTVAGNQEAFVIFGACTPP
jgi:hypothetical protein